MVFLDGRAVTSVIAAAKRSKPMPLEEWLRLDNSLNGAGPAADRLLEQLEVATEDAEAPPRRES